MTGQILGVALMEELCQTKKKIKNHSDILTTVVESADDVGFCTQEHTLKFGLLQVIVSISPLIKSKIRLI